MRWEGGVNILFEKLRIALIFISITKPVKEAKVHLFSGISFSGVQLRKPKKVVKL